MSQQHPRDSQKITPRLIQVLCLVARGFPDKKIGERLCTSSKTAKTHVAILLGRTGKTTRAALVVWALSEGYLRLDTASEAGVTLGEVADRDELLKDLDLQEVSA